LSGEASANIRCFKPQDIIVEQWTKRQYVDEEFLDRLGEDIRSRRLEEPIKVRVKDGKPYLVSGFQRLMASIRSGVKVVECRVVDGDDWEAYVSHCRENSLRRDISPFDLARKIEYGCKVLKKPLAVVAEVNGITVDVAKKLLRLQQLPDCVKQAVRYRTVEWTKLYELLPIKNRPEICEVANWLARRFDEGDTPTIEEIRGKVRLFKSKRRRNGDTPRLRCRRCMEVFDEDEVEWVCLCKSCISELKLFRR
jgi:ParB/RepB/Spo0J family partition protein